MATVIDGLEVTEGEEMDLGKLCLFARVQLGGESLGFRVEKSEDAESNEKNKSKLLSAIRNLILVRSLNGDH